MITQLSEAIRIGSMLSPQGRTGIMSGPERCALAAAADAVGMDALWNSMLTQRLVNYDALEQRFPILRRWAEHPMGRGIPLMPVRNIIWALNDSYGWTRAQIAVWLESVERALAVPADGQRAHSAGCGHEDRWVVS